MSFEGGGGGSEKMLFTPPPLSLLKPRIPLLFIVLLFGTVGVNTAMIYDVNSSALKKKYLSTKMESRGGRPTISISSPNHILLIFSSEPPRNPRPFNIIFFKCLILPDKTIFKESGHVRA